jgi:hypothetical protein
MWKWNLSHVSNINLCWIRYCCLISEAYKERSWNLFLPNFIFHSFLVALCSCHHLREFVKGLSSVSNHTPSQCLDILGRRHHECASSLPYLTDKQWCNLAQWICIAHWTVRHYLMLSISDYSFHGWPFYSYTLKCYSPWRRLWFDHWICMLWTWQILERQLNIITTTVIIIVYR